jgi:hypothetical protein
MSSVVAPEVCTDPQPGLTAQTRLPARAMKILPDLPDSRVRRQARSRGGRRHRLVDQCARRHSRLGNRDRRQPGHPRRRQSQASLASVGRVRGSRRSPAARRPGRLRRGVRRLLLVARPANLAKIDAFLETLMRRLLPGSLAVFVDNRLAPGSVHPVARRDAQGNTYQERRMRDGTSWDVIKNFPDPDELRTRLSSFGQSVGVDELDNYWLAWCRK